MRSQQQKGGKSNETLGRRIKLSWCLPSLKKCEAIIKDGVKIYPNGDENVRPHRSQLFSSGRAKSYKVSKVIG